MGWAGRPGLRVLGRHNGQSFCIIHTDTCTILLPSIQPWSKLKSSFKSIDRSIGISRLITLLPNTFGGHLQRPSVGIPTPGWGEITRILGSWRQGFRHPTRKNVCMGRFVQIHNFLGETQSDYVPSMNNAIQVPCNTSCVARF